MPKSKISLDKAQMTKLMRQLGCSPLKQLNPSVDGRMLSSDRCIAEPQAIGDTEQRHAVSANLGNQASPLDESKVSGMFLLLV